METALRLLALVLCLALLAVPAAAAVSGETTPTEDGTLNLTAEEAIATREAPDIHAASIYGEVTATAVMDHDTLPEELDKALEKAYRKLVFTRTLHRAVPELKDFLEKSYPAMDEDSLEVRELFHVAVEKNKGAVTLEFEQELKKGDFLLVLRCVDGTWQIENPELVKITSDGNVRVKFENGLGILAFLTEKAQAE